MTSRITHLTVLPKNIDYWDYYILCRCNDNAAGVLQRMEFWDGTKADGNIHGEQINDHLVETKQIASQDTSRFVYKTSEELAWEMIGTCSEKTSRVTLSLLTDTLQYLTQRRNPYNTFDRTKQYAFQEKLVQEHLDRLYLIVKHFQDIGRQQRPVLYAIEQLTGEGVYVHRIQQEDGTPDGKDTLSIELVANYLKKMHGQMAIDEQEGQKKREDKKGKYVPLLPTFIKFDLKKDEVRGFSTTVSLPSGKFTGSNSTILPDGNGNNDRMETDTEPDGNGKNTGAIPVTTNNNNKDTYVAPAFADRNGTPAFSLEDQSSQQFSTPTEDLSPESVDKSAQTDNDPSVPPQASVQSYSRTTTQTTTPAQSPDTSRTGTPPSEKPKRVRKPKVEDPITAERIDKVVVYFDQLLQEVTGDAKAEYGKTKVARTDIREILLPCNPTEKRLRKIYLALWNTPPDPKTGFHWRDNMSIKAVCKQYQSKVIGIIAEEQKEADKQKTKQVMDTVIANPSLMVQQEEDYVFDINRVRGNSHRGRRSAS